MPDRGQRSRCSWKPRQSPEAPRIVESHTTLTCSPSPPASATAGLLGGHRDQRKCPLVPSTCAPFLEQGSPSILPRPLSNPLLLLDPKPRGWGVSCPVSPKAFPESTTAGENGQDRSGLPHRALSSGKQDIRELRVTSPLGCVELVGSGMGQRGALRGRTPLLPASRPLSLPGVGGAPVQCFFFGGGGGRGGRKPHCRGGTWPDTGVEAEPRGGSGGSGRPPGTTLPSHSPPRGAASGIQWGPALRVEWSGLSASLSPQGRFPRNSVRSAGLPQTLFQATSFAPSHRGGEQPDVRVAGECCGAGPRLPPWVFGGWMATKKSSNSLAVWLRISLKGSKGFINQTWHLGKPWNLWAREAAVPGGQPRQLDLLRRGSSMLPERSGPLITRPRHATSPCSTLGTHMRHGSFPDLGDGQGRNRYRKATMVTRRSLSLVFSPESWQPPRGPFAISYTCQLTGRFPWPRVAHSSLGIRRL